MSGHAGSALTRAPLRPAAKLGAAPLGDASGDPSPPGAHPVILLLIYALFIPEELSLYVGDMRLTVARIITIAVFPWVAVRFVALVASDRGVLTDLMVLLAGAWMMVAVSNVTSFDSALAHAAPEVLDFCGAYLICRVFITQPGQVVAAMSALCTAICVVALLSPLDTIFSRYVVHELGSGLTGYVKIRQIDYRLGLFRAASSMEHPIHLGVVCALNLIIVAALPVRAKVLKFVVSAAGLTLSFSSAPMQASVMGICLLVYDRFVPDNRLKWHGLTAVLVAFVGLTFLVSNSPIGFIGTHLVFDPVSAWSRQYEWQTAGSVVQDFPWFGIAYGWPEIARQTGAFESIDSIWLALSVSYGLPAAILVGLSFATAAWVRSNLRPSSAQDPVLAADKLLSILITCIAFIGFTVHFWASTYVMIGVILGLKSGLRSSLRGVRSDPVPTRAAQPALVGANAL